MNGALLARLQGGSVSVCNSWQKVGSMLAIAGVLLQFAGCVENEYEIKMSLDDGRVVRSLAGRSASSGEPLSLEEEEHIAATYGTDVRHQEGQSVVSGTFDGRLPADIGGAGFVHLYQSPMGQLGVYVERFRGNDDLTSQLERMNRAIERLVELARLWVRMEGRDADVEGRIEAYLAGEAVRDLKNVCLIVWTQSAGADLHADETAWAEALARIVQYALERGYLGLEDVPTILRMEQATPESKMRLFRELIAKRLQMDVDGIARVFPALASQAAFEASLTRLSSMLLMASAEEVKALLTDCLPFRLSDFDRLNVQFHLPRRPFALNGDWLDDSRIKWTASISVPDAPPGEFLPTQLFCAWSQPNEAYQQRRFGRVILTGRELADYVLWYRGLSDSESQEWDAFLTEVTPEDDLLNRLKAFRFSGDTEPMEDQNSLLDVPRRLFEAALSQGST